jgi:PAS domain S-box-containing protein
MDKHGEEALRKKCDLFDRILNKIFECVAVIDRDFKIREVNTCFGEQYRKTREQIIGSYCYEVTHNSNEPCRGDTHPCPLVSVFETGESFHTEHIHINRKGEKRIVEVSAYPLFDASGEVESIVEINLDITRRKRAEEQLRTALKEKEVLLKEIHHRVKNNFQTISSLLSLQSVYIKDEQTLELFKNSQGRIKTMALIHEKLYESRDLSKIDFNEYIRSLTAHIFDSYLLQPGQVRLKIKIKKDIRLNIDTAIPIGLIINELVSNSLKYAFPESRKGDIQVNLGNCIDNKYDYTLIVADNGVGILEEINFEKSNSLGMSIIYAMVKQLHGVINLDKKRGTTFTIKFRKLKGKK